MAGLVLFLLDVVVHCWRVLWSWVDTTTCCL